MGGGAGGNRLLAEHLNKLCCCPRVPIASVSSVERVEAWTRDYSSSLKVTKQHLILIYVIDHLCGIRV